MTPTDLIAQAEAVMDRAVWVVFDNAPNAGGSPAYVTARDPRPLPDRLEAVPHVSAASLRALIARIRELEGGTDARLRAATLALARADEKRDAAEAKLAEVEKERDELRAAIFGSPNYAPELRNGNFREMAETLHAAQKHGQATVATLTAQVEAMRGALEANLTFAEKVAEAADIDTEETALNVRVMPEGREVARRTWAEIIAQGRAALTTENQTNG